MMSDLSWHQAIQHCQDNAKAYALVTLLDSMGSTPRNSGTKMVICEDSIYDTLGGGHLEFEITKKARELLANKRDAQHIEHYPLSSKLGQCCGGSTIALFEIFYCHVQPLVVFGAGHVAKALMPILSQLPMAITWVDPRAEMFESCGDYRNINKLVTDEPQEIISDLADNTWILILTHNHQLDFDLVFKALNTSQFPFLGMIGSRTKAKRFRTKLQHRGLSEQQISSLTSPVGLTDIPGKRPIEVAVSISAQLITMLEGAQVPDKKQQAQKWLQTKSILEL